MKLPKLITGWMNPRTQKVHDTREEAYEAALKEELLDQLYKRVGRGGGFHLPPEVAADVVMQHFHIEPKHIEESE